MSANFAILVHWVVVAGSVTPLIAIVATQTMVHDHEDADAWVLVRWMLRVIAFTLLSTRAVDVYFAILHHGKLVTPVFLDPITTESAP